MDVNQLKNHILDLLPRSVSTAIYAIRHGEVVVKTEAADGVVFEMGVPERSKDHLTEDNERGIRDWLKKYLKPKDVFYDVGSCFGYYPSFISHIQPELEIHAFEPTWRHTQFIRKNMLRNANPDNPWRIIEKFAGDKNEDNILTLDSYSEKHSINPSVIKMDIDGGEFAALQGCRRIIAEKTTEFLIELHPMILHTKNITIDHIIALFEGYKIKVLPNIRGKGEGWSENINDIRADINPYVYFAPRETARF